MAWQKLLSGSGPVATTQYANPDPGWRTSVEFVGMPKWTEEEHNLAKALQRNLKSKDEGAAQRVLAAAWIAPGRVV